jgi:SAM-dependent methyltransferase
MGKRTITDLIQTFSTYIFRRFIPTYYKQTPALQLSRKYIYSLLYYGSNVHCPYCNKTFKRFLPAGVIPRPNSQCPTCGSVERYRLLYLYLKNKTKFFSKNLKVLDIGPSHCFSKLCRSLSNIQYVSIDLFSRSAMLKMDLKKLAFKERTFDCITCFHVLEHIKDDLYAMREMFRVLRPDGWALVQIPLDINRVDTFENFKIHEKDYETVYGQFDHVRIYGLDFTHRLEGVGFSVRIDHYIDELDDITISKFGLKRSYKSKLYKTRDDIYYCSKQ